MALDFDFDKLDKAISEIMGDIDGTNSEQQKNRGEANSSVRKARPSVDRTVAMSVSSGQPHRRKPKVAMIGGKVTNKLSQKPVQAPKKFESSYTKPGEGRFLDMVSPSSDALNQHKPSVNAGEKLSSASINGAVSHANRVRAATQSKAAPRHTPQVAHRSNRHELSQPLPEAPSANTFVSAADKGEPYMSPFLPQASEMVKKRPLGARSSYSGNSARQRTSDGDASRGRQVDNYVASRHGNNSELNQIASKPKKKSRAKEIVAKIALFIGVIIVGGLVGILCFYLLG